MPRWRVVAAVLGALPPGMAALARADAPPTMPRVDATVRYHVVPAGKAAEDVRVFFGGGGALVRIDGANGEGETILDGNRRTLTVVVTGARAFMTIPLRGPVNDPFMLSRSMNYQRGERGLTVAGVSCDDWEVRSSRGDAVACVTADGLLLAADGVDGEGARGTLRATQVDIGPLAPGVFAPPPGFQRIAHPDARGAAAP